MFPKKGKFFPESARNAGKGLNYASAVAAGLRRELGDTHQAVKTVMKWTGANERTVKNWLAGRYGPNGEHLICLFRHSNEVLDANLRLAGRDEGIAVREIGAVREALASALLKIDLLMSERSHAR
jgi:pyocin large subunit-like protein